MTYHFFTKILDQALDKDKLKQENQDYTCKNTAGCVFSEEDRYAKQIEKDKMRG